MPGTPTPGSHGFQAVIGDLQARVSALEVALRLGAVRWQPLALAANITAYGAGYAQPGVEVQPSGVAQLRGVLKATAGVPANTVLFTLPVGARPASNALMAVPCTASGTQAVVYLLISTAGTVVLGAALIANDYAALDGVVFSTV